MASKKDELANSENIAAVAFVLGKKPSELSGFVVLGVTPGGQVHYGTNRCCRTHAVDVLAQAIRAISLSLPHDGHPAS